MRHKYKYPKGEIFYGLYDKVHWIVVKKSKQRYDMLALYNNNRKTNVSEKYLDEAYIPIKAKMFKVLYGI